MIEAKKKDHSYRVFRKVNRKANSFPMADDYSFSEQPKDVTVWCSNDYLGMSRNPKVVDAAKYDAFSSPSFHFFYNYMTDYILVRVQWTSGYWSKTTLKTVSVLIVVLFFVGLIWSLIVFLTHSFTHPPSFIHSLIHPQSGYRWERGWSRRNEKYLRNKFVSWYARTSTCWLASKGGWPCFYFMLRGQRHGPVHTRATTPRMHNLFWCSQSCLHDPWYI